MAQLSDIEISRQVRPRPIEEIAAKAGVPESALHRYGPDKAKISFDFIETLPARPDARLILVTAINPTPAGEGKTTTTIGLGDALTRLGARTMVCLREPSLGPCFGIKGGATGGGWSQVIPMEAINLHFTGDFHAIGAAHNLLSALIDNHVYWGNALDLDTRGLTWRRAVDMNDRALRQIVTGLGNNGAAREDGFDITVASEVMAIFCLASGLADLKARLGRIVVGRNRAKAAVTARDLQAEGSMAVLLRDALMPNLVQTLEGTPALIHGGPFANIAHGCNSVIATRLGLKLADFVVTEAGFGADLGAEKFLDIKCRAAGLTPSAAVLVATVRALKMHGGVPRDGLSEENVAAVEAGLANLRRHVENLRQFGLPVLVAINEFTGDTAAEYEAIVRTCAALGVECHRCSHWRDGGRGAEALAAAVRRTVTEPAVGEPAVGENGFRLLYPDALPLAEKIRTVAQRIYRAHDVVLPKSVAKKLAQFEAAGAGGFPICMAKTQYSFSTDPEALGAPDDHLVTVRDVRLSNGAGFVVALCGDVMTMPGLPRSPAAERIDLDEAGRIQGLF